MPGNSDWTPYQLASPTGANLSVRSLSAVEPRVLVQINHGMAEHSIRYRRFAEHLVSRGHAVIAHDHRGHGKTTAPGAAIGHFGDGGWDAVIADVIAVQAHAAERWPGVPIVCFGHSMGGMIAFNVVLRHAGSFAGAAIWNCAFETGALGQVFRSLLKAERLFKGSDVPSGFATKITFDAWNKEFAPNRTTFDWLSRDDAEVDLYVADPLCGYEVTIGMWLEVLSGIYFGADDRNLAGLPKTLPLHLVAGEKDPCTQHGKAIRNLSERLKRAGLSDVTTRILADTRHESLNEINRDATMTEFSDWLDARFGQ
jgi:alpha-beta hydrolase superfamily lysophospholipase